ncbi:DNA-binding transcriptional repressor DeoR, partial [Pseudomonas syringae]
TLAATGGRPGDTVVVDGGASLPFVVGCSRGELECPAGCSALNVLLKLQQKPNCSIGLCGGMFHRKNQVFESHAETSILDGVRLTWAVVSAAGVSLDCGATCFNFHEVEVTQKVIRQARQRLLLADHSTFDAVRTAHSGAFTDFHCVVSAKTFPRRYPR